MANHRILALVLSTSLLIPGLCVSSPAEIGRLLQNNQPGQAEKLLEQWQPSQSERWQYDFFRAQIDFAAGKHSRAIKTLRSLIKQHPYPEAVNNLAASLIADGRQDEAEQLLVEAISTDPRFGVLYENLSRIFSHKAGLAYQQALKLDKPPAPLVLKQIHQPVTGETARPLRVTAPKNSHAAADPENVMKTIRNWANAWSQQDVNTYLSQYSDSFRPIDGTELNTWKGYRRNRLRAPEFIQVKFSDVDVQFLADQQIAQVHLLQHYRSNTFRESVYKLLILRKESQDWRIIVEAVR